MVRKATVHNIQSRIRQGSTEIFVAYMACWPVLVFLARLHEVFLLLLDDSETRFLLAFPSSSVRPRTPLFQLLKDTAFVETSFPKQVAAKL